MARLVKKCPCLRPQIEDDVQVLDYRHYSLTDVPGDVFNFERTLEELYVDSNQIQDLPRELFYCHGLRKLSISDNEITNIPPAISSLVSLEELDLSKNGIIDIPESIKSCKYLQSIDASVNPLGKLPDGFTQLLNLTQLYLNDTFLDYLPGNFGRLSKLRTLEIRENHLKTLPKSFSRLMDLEKLDIGHNEFTELPDVIGNLCNLLELWCDQNQITTITPTIGNLKQLMFLDACRNQLQSLPAEIEGCTSLADLHLTSNQLKELPDSIGNLSNMTTLKVDDNLLVSLPSTIGGLTALSELNVSINDLQDLPASIGLLRNLRTIYMDENQMEFIPAELGSCSGITVLSLRGNRLEYIPDEIGRIPHLRVLNISNNNLKYLPFTFIKLKELQAMWLSENQTRPLIPLQSEYDHDTGRKILTCYLLPQGPPLDTGEVNGDTDSFHASMWEEERRHRQTIHFEFGDESDADGKLIRCPTPYPKEMREKLRHIRNLQRRQNMLSNGEPQWSKGEDNPAYEEQMRRQVISSMERLNLLSNEIIDRGRHSKSSSPSLKDSHKLYKYDKEKFAKDKARLHHTTHVVDKDHGSSHQRDDKPDKSRKSPDSKSRKNEDDDDGFSISRVLSIGSAPDIPTQSMYAEKTSRPHQSEKHNHSQSHHSHRHHRMRDYDSDTGYRSDQEVLRLRRQQQLMYGIGIDPSNRRDNQSDIFHAVRHKSHHRHRDGYSSDLEGYKNRPVGISCMTAPIQQQHNANSLPYKLNQQTQSHSSQKTYLTEIVKGNELYSQTVGNTKTISNQNLTVGEDSIGGLSSSINPSYPPHSPSPLHKSRILDQSTPMSPNSAQSFSFPSDHNNPISLEKKPIERLEDWRKDLFNSVEQCRINNSEQTKRYLPNPQSHQSNLPPGGSPPPYKPAPPYSASPIQRQLPSTPHRASPYGRQLRQSPLREFQKMPDIQEHTDSAKNDMKTIPEDLLRSKSQNGYHHGDYQNQGTPNMISDKSIAVSKPYCSSQPLSYENPSALMFQYGSDLMSRTPKSQVNSQNNDSWKDPNVLNQRVPSTLNDSPLSARCFRPRNSPLIGVVDRFGGIVSSLLETPRNIDNSFQDVPSKFDDIAMYKNADPASQMSSSTDSGYVQGQNTFDKYSGGCGKSPSQGSPSPEQYNSESPYTASPHRDIVSPPSKEPTPVSTLSEVRSGSNSSPRDTSNMRACERFRVTVTKNPGLGFSIAGGLGSFGNPYRPGDMGIFVTKIQQEGPAAISLQPGDKLLEVNGINFGHIEHDKAVSILKNSNAVSLYVERDSPS
ncbi:hypothetical protein CHS0354_033621 [Potamilus streckersoni]|uniref:PDZ domain-containing protein n=1 Tax=Potamilus streckersoni TaxID=2493646 RepID=A0AAE0SSS6_9BIVA|nr:hypothetical protein CHS0354_033621 [Potamilus streckersoni]